MEMKWDDRGRSWQQEMYGMGENEQDQDLYAFLQNMISLRKTEPAFGSGGSFQLYITVKNCLLMKNVLRNRPFYFSSTFLSNLKQLRFLQKTFWKATIIQPFKMME